MIEDKELLDLVDALEEGEVLTFEKRNVKEGLIRLYKYDNEGKKYTVEQIFGLSNPLLKRDKHFSIMMLFARMQYMFRKHFEDRNHASNKDNTTESNQD